MPEGGRTVIGWVMIGGIIALILLIMGILFGNLSGNVGFAQKTSTFSNNTVTLGALTNVTDLTVKINPSITNAIVTNASGGEVLDSGNYTFDGGQINATAISLFIGQNVNVSGTLNYDVQGKVDADNIILNYTSGAVNTAKQLPTTGTIVGIALLLLVLLFILGFAVSRLMKMSGGGNFRSGGVSSGSSRFTGSNNSEIA